MPPGRTGSNLSDFETKKDTRRWIRRNEMRTVLFVITILVLNWASQFVVLMYNLPTKSTPGFAQFIIMMLLLFIFMDCAEILRKRNE